jgi:ABC-type branched-subunit amino acid transport system ATPase component/ABC-type branched-subunit amino acid transport system permease subunit
VAERTQEFSSSAAHSLRDAYEDFVGRLRAAPEAYAAATRPLFAIAIAMIAFAGLIPLFAGPGDAIIAQRSLYLGLLALSVNFLVANVGLISFGHAMFWALGAYLVGIPFAKEVPFFQDPLVALAFTPLMGAVAGFVIGLVVFRGRELYFSLLTLGVGQLIWAIAHGWQSLTGGTNGTNGVFAADWINSFQHPDQLYWFIFGAVLICTGAVYVITRSPFGDALRGIRENRRRAEFAGLWVKRYELTAFVISATFASIAGGLSVLGETQVNSAQIDWGLSTRALIVALIGGTRYFLGPFAGAFFYLFVFSEVIERTVLWDTVLGVIVLGVALVLSGGLGGLLHWLLAQGIALYRKVAGKAEAVAAPAVEAAEAEAAVHLPDVEPAAPPAAPVAWEERELVLDVRNLTKSFGGLVAVNDVSFHVRRGAIHAIIGPNGAGKTTLFNLITGLHKPDSGQVLLEGEDITGGEPWKLVKRGIGRSFQQTNLFWELSALTNVTIAGSAAERGTRKLYGSHPPGVIERAATLLDRVGLAAFGQTGARELSHGDQRSLEIATALAVESRFLLLDEPTAGISPAETRTAVELIRKIARDQNLTVLFVEHDMEVVFGIADYITVLHYGAVLAEGTPEQIRANPDVQRAYLGEITEEEVAG